MKSIKYFVVVFVLTLLLPVAVKADRSPLAFDGYANEGAVGSEITFTIKGTDYFDGTITYNKDELDLVSETVYDPTIIADVAGPTGTIKYNSKNPGKLVFKFALEEGASNGSYKALMFTFKVKAAPNGKVDIVYTPDNTDVLYGSKNYTRTYTILGQATNCEATTGSTDITTDQSSTTDTTTDTVTSPPVVSTSSNDTLLYVSFGIIGLLLVIVIVMAIKKRKHD